MPFGQLVRKVMLIWCIRAALELAKDIRQQAAAVCALIIQPTRRCGKGYKGYKGGRCYQPMKAQHHALSAMSASDYVSFMRML